MLLESVNFHLYKPYKEHCAFCFATFRDAEGQWPLDDVRRVVGALRRGGHGASLDRVGLSADSCEETLQQTLGRGRGDHVERTIAHADLLRSVDVQVKLNTLVTAPTCGEDMSAFVRRVAPERWKVFHVLPAKGQNDGHVEQLLISTYEFLVFVLRHQRLDAEGLAPIVEDNDALRGSYAMIDPLGRFFGNATGEHVYSAPILEVGVSAARAQVGFSAAKFEHRGGRYAW